MQERSFACLGTARAPFGGAAQRRGRRACAPRAPSSPTLKASCASCHDSSSASQPLRPGRVCSEHGRHKGPHLYPTKREGGVLRHCIRSAQQHTWQQ